MLSLLLTQPSTCYKHRKLVTALKRERRRNFETALTLGSVARTTVSPTFGSCNLQIHECSTSRPSRRRSPCPVFRTGRLVGRTGSLLSTTFSEFPALYKLRNLERSTSRSSPGHSPVYLFVLSGQLASSFVSCVSRNFLVCSTAPPSLGPRTSPTFPLSRLGGRTGPVR